MTDAKTDARQIIPGSGRIAPHRNPTLLMGVAATALVLAFCGLGWSYSLSKRLTRQEQALDQANDDNSHLQIELRETNARLRVTTDQLGESLGLTQKQLEARTQEVMEHAKADSARLAAQQKTASRQISEVSTQVSDVRTDVGGVKTDVAKAKSDLANAVNQLTSMQGDVSGHTSLIARNRDELEILKHKGDRNFYEFSLNKGDRKPVSTVSVELKKADHKKSRFTLVIYSDDLKVEKKDRNINEPLQFYTGRERLLYEIVVNSISEKNQVAGYISTPKGAPVPTAVR